MEQKNLIEIEIKDLAFDGKAVGQMESGKICFVNGGLPGEIVEAELVKKKRRFNVARFKRVIKKSDKRITPPCKHFDICGGCTWQDLTYEDQLMYKQNQVVACIERIGKLENVKIHSILGTEDIFRYRNKMEYSFNKNGGSFNLGMHHRGEFNSVFDLTECHITQEIDSKIVAWFREYVHINELPAYDVKYHGGYMRFIMLRQACNTNQLMVNVVTNYGDFPDSEKLVSELLDAFPQITTIVHNQNGQKSNISAGEFETILHGPGYIEEIILDKRFRIRANSFFQTNSRQAERLYQTGFEMLNADKDENLLDLYCGTGSIGILIAPSVQNVIGVELVSDAIEAAKVNAGINKIENISFYTGDVKDFLRDMPEDKKDIDIIIVDPPRAGLNPKVIRRMLRLKPSKILYISCNPATFARDAGELAENGYELPEIKPVDMFPHTMHIELASVFYRK